MLHDFRYPFDIQFCPIKLSKPEDHLQLFALEWRKSPYLHTINTLQYEVMDNLMYNTSNATKDTITVYIKLRRKLSHHIFNTYIPTFCLTMISAFTLYIDVSHFEATIMVALTAMLVIYTLHQSISASLPNTPYMKMIDIWLFGGLIFPFLTIGILVILDYLIIRETNQVSDIRNKGKCKSKWNSQTFLRCMQILLPISNGLFCITYWIIGLSYYYTTDYTQEFHRNCLSLPDYLDYCGVSNN